MPSPSGIGTTDIQLGVLGTIRADISNILLANLVLANNFAASVRVGAYFNDTICRWTEDRLNANFVTDTQAGGLTTSTAQLVLSTNDASLLAVGAQLMDVSAAAGGIGGGEMVAVASANSQSGVIQITRAAFGTTATTHAQGAVWQIIGKPTAEFTDLGPDTSRARVPKWNYVERQEVNVSLSAEVITRSTGGYTPGINDELRYQMDNRVQELLRYWDTSFLYGRPYIGQSGTLGVVATDYSSFGGLRAWLDGSMNSIFSPTPTTTTINWQSQGFSSVDQAINYANLQANRNGAVPNVELFGFNGAQAASKLYRDEIRITQRENERGFSADVMHTPLGNELVFLMDGYVVDAATIGELYTLDLDRIRIRPLLDQWFYMFTAPTLRDGDSYRALSKCSFEIRNTATDAGQAHYLTVAGTFS